jgi:hypothetical protein
MNHEEIRELAAMDALGGLDGGNRARFGSGSPLPRARQHQA